MQHSAQNPTCHRNTTERWLNDWISCLSVNPSFAISAVNTKMLTCFMITWYLLYFSKNIFLWDYIIIPDFSRNIESVTFKKKILFINCLRNRYVVTQISPSQSAMYRPLRVLRRSCTTTSCLAPTPPVTKVHVAPAPWLPPSPILTPARRGPWPSIASVPEGLLSLPTQEMLVLCAYINSSILVLPSYEKRGDNVKFCITS